MLDKEAAEQEISKVLNGWASYFHLKCERANRTIHFEDEMNIIKQELMYLLFPKLNPEAKGTDSRGSVHGE